METILIVDDEAGMAFALQTVLKRAGFQTVLATDGNQAFEEATQNNPQLIILSDLLDDNAGGRLCIRFKSAPQTRNVPVIIYGGGIHLDNPDYVKRIQADAVLRRPSQGADLLKTVRKLLDIREDTFRPTK